MDVNVTPNLFRLFLWIFSIAVIVGTAGIILQVRLHTVESDSNVLTKNLRERVKLANIKVLLRLCPLHDTHNLQILRQAPSLYDLCMTCVRAPFE